MTDKPRDLDDLVEALGKRAGSDGIEYCDRISLSNESEDLVACELNAWAAHLSRLIDCPEPIIQQCIDDSCDLYADAVTHCEELYGTS